MRKIGVTYQARCNSYFANFNGHQYVFAVNRYGPLAQELAIEYRKQKEQENGYLSSEE